VGIIISFGESGVAQGRAIGNSLGLLSKAGLRLIDPCWEWYNLNASQKVIICTVVKVADNE